MARINKQVIKDFFGSFFGQYSLTKEQFDKIRDLVNKAECGCCQIATIYWLIDDESDANPATQQVIFKDADDVVLVQTSLTGTSPQRICVPANATQLCVNITAETTGGAVVVRGDDGYVTGFVDTVGEECDALNGSTSEVYFVSTAAA